MKFNKGLAKGIAKISLVVLFLFLVGVFVVKFVLPIFAQGETKQIYFVVKDSSGQAVANARVEMFVSDSLDGDYSLIASESTGSDGTATISTSASGYAYFVVSKLGYEFEWPDETGIYSESADAYVISVSDIPSSINITLDVIPAIWTDKSEYAPEETVYIYGYAFDVPTVHLVISVQGNIVNEQDVSIVDCGFETSFKLNGIVDTYTVTASYDGKVLAITTFGDCLYQTCVKLYPVADSWVDEGDKNANHGTDTELHVKNQTKNKDRMSFLKFDLSSIPSSITSAKLNVYKSGGDRDSQTVYVNLVLDDSWTETGITWNNMPSYSTLCGSTSVGGANNYYTWTVTSCAQGEYSGDKIISLVMRLTNNGEHKDFWSKEQSGENQDPYLEVCYEKSCSDYTSESSCEADLNCDWCPSCSAYKWSGGPDRCVNAGTCNYWCEYKPTTYCGAQCEDNSDCGDKCVMNTRYYNGQCTSGCTCSYSTQDCDSLDCTTGLTCSGTGTDTITELGDDYACWFGTTAQCESHAQKTCKGPWVCNNSKLCQSQTCGSQTYTCYYENGYKWGTPPTSETICNDNIDNDCDGKTDCADPDCVGQMGPKGNKCCNSNSDCESFGTPYYYPEIATCEYNPDNYLPTFDYRPEYPGYCDTGTHECLAYTPAEISHTCADSNSSDGGPEVPSGHLRTCSAECDGYGTEECQPYISGDTCFYGGSCNTDPTACTCSYSSSQFCPEAGYTNGTHCWWGTRDCSSNGCGLTITEMGCKNYCDANSGPQDTIGPGTYNVQVNPIPPKYDPVKDKYLTNFTATVSDTCSNITAAEYFVRKSLYCGPAGTGTPMQPVDGSFNELTEDVIAQHEFSGGDDGWWWVCVRGKDEAGNWGDCNCTQFGVDTIPPDCPTNISMPELVCGNYTNFSETICDSQSNIQAAKYYFDRNYFVGYWMNASDGQFGDEICEDVFAVLNLSSLFDGCHKIESHGKDTAENWGKLPPYYCSASERSFILDRTPPVTNKTITGLKRGCTAEEKSLYGFEDCQYITNTTQISFSATDPNAPCNSDAPKVYYKIGYKVNWIDEWQWSGPFEYNGTPITLGEDSYHLIEYWSVDLCGNEEEHKFELDIVDTLPPIIEKDFIGPTYYNETEGKLYIDGVTVIQINATDQQPHPVGGVLCDWSYKVNGGGGGPYTGMKPPFNISFEEESTHEVTIACRDALGNEGVLEFTVIVDKTPPETYKEYGEPYHFLCHEWKEEKLDGGKPINVCVNYTEWVNSSTPIILTVEDTGPHKSGIKETKYRVTSVDEEYCFNPTPCQEATGSGDWQTYEHPFTISEESCHLIEYYSVDNVNKTEEVKKQCVFVDNTGPTVAKFIGEPKVDCSQGEGCNYYINQSTLITLQCIDQNPHPVGGDKIYYRYKVDGGDWSEWILYTGPFHFTEDSLHTLEYYCVDKLGNVGETLSEADKVDTVAPNTTKTYGTPYHTDGTSEWINSSTPITLTAQDGGAVCAVGLDKIYYRVTLLENNEACESQSACAQAEGSGDWSTYEEPFTVSEDSCHLIEYYSTDLLGNAEPVKKQCVYVDNKVPISSKSIGEPKVEFYDYEYADECNNGIGYSIPGIGPDCNKIDCCNMFQIAHVHDLGQVLQPGNVYMEFTPGFGDGCKDTAKFYYSADNITWTQFYSQPVTSHWIENYGWQKYNTTQYVPGNFRYIKIEIPYCYNDYSNAKYLTGPYVTQQTQINLTCSDQLPHPVDQVKIYYKIDWRNESSDPWQEGQWQQGADFVSFTYDKDSYHRLTWYCVDALGDKEQEHVELDIVDTQAPVTTKTVGNPKVSCGENCWYITSATNITLTCSDQEPHPVGEDKIYYRYYLDGQLIKDWTEYTAPFSLPEESSHTLEYYCVDKLGNEEPIRTEIDNVDNTPPEIIKAWVDDCSVHCGTPVKIFVNVTDAKVGVEAVTANINDISGNLITTVTLTYNSTSGYYEGTWTPSCSLSEGTYYIDITASDLLGNTATLTKATWVNVDNKKPWIYWVFSGKDWVGYGTTFYVAAEVTDNSLTSPSFKEICEPEISCVARIVDNTGKESVLDGSLTFNREIGKCTGFVTVNETFNESPANLYVDAWDNAGNYRDDVYTLIGIDNTPPIRVTFYTNPSATSFIKSGQRIFYNITLNQDMSGLESTCFLSMDETSWDSSPIMDSSCSGYYVVPTGLEDGAVQLILRVKDIAGNWLEDSINFMLDNSAPTKEILSPVFNASYSSYIPFLVNITDHAGVNDSTAQFRISNDWGCLQTNPFNPLDPWTWVCFLKYDSTWITLNHNSLYWYNYSTENMSEGMYYFRVKVCDILGNCGDPQGLIIIDKTAPSWPSRAKLTVTYSPYDRDGNITLSWPEASDASGIDHYNIYVYNSTGDLILANSTNETSYEIYNLENGVYTFNVTAVDRAQPIGNENSGLSGATIVDNGCSVDITCRPPTSPSAPTGGGGFVLPTCTENWTCTDWSACSPEGKQTRTCTDLNRCGTTRNKPAEIQNCTYFAAYCGDGTCQANENCSTCPTDCGPCPPPVTICGNAVCEAGEDYTNCCSDCSCPTGMICDTTTNACYTPTPPLGITGMVIGVLSNPVYASIIAIIIIATIVVVLRKRYVPIRKGLKKGTR